MDFKCLLEQMSSRVGRECNIDLFTESVSVDLQMYQYSNRDIVVARVTQKLKVLIK